MNILTKTKNFIKEFWAWKRSGGQYRDDKKIDELFKICSSNKCGKYISKKDDVGQCELCGCYLRTSKDKNLNKLAMDSTRCPHDPPYWVEEEEIKMATQKAAPPKKGRDCGC